MCLFLSELEDEIVRKAIKVPKWNLEESPVCSSKLEYQTFGFNLGELEHEIVGKTVEIFLTALLR